MKQRTESERWHRLGKLANEMRQAFYRASVWRRDQASKANVTSAALRRDLTYEKILVVERKKKGERNG
ncbi:MAG: hypothetical protein IH914_10380 [candidate division Zixibacteria bacterium]|nr:hypothetical protein [candidate division Zixibacteria bacterium]